MLPPPSPPREATDIFYITDQVLADRLQFIEEIGQGNWGSVWLCRPKPESSGVHNGPVPKIAVKLVHRRQASQVPEDEQSDGQTLPPLPDQPSDSFKKTTAARVKSLWNEMKIVRSLREEPHRSIIPFDSFIITPSYALITMPYHPHLVPVEVPEQYSREWFRSLLSGVEFLHKRGIVHNDIKPANILLSYENVPVLIDFGFAEQYNLNSSHAFHSNLSYGTPEYLSPERARGLPHDTRKSDVWSLGVTFFEILHGRTPFEACAGEEFCSHADLERYWNRTLKGKWLGSWKMSKGLERLLRRMIQPNADLRYTASHAMSDSYWSQKDVQSPVHAHKKSGSVSDKENSKLVTLTPPWARASEEKEKSKAKQLATKTAKGKENIATPPGLGPVKAGADKRSHVLQPRHNRENSQSRGPVLDIRNHNQPRKNIVLPSLLATLSPIKPTPSPPPPPAQISSSSKENAPQGPRPTRSRTLRKPLGPRDPTPPSSPANSSLNLSLRLHKEAAEEAYPPLTSHLFRDVTAAERSIDNVSSGWDSSVAKEQKSPDSSQNDSVRMRMREWERERARLRELVRDAEEGADERLEREGTRREASPEHERTFEKAEEAKQKPGSPERGERRPPRIVIGKMSILTPPDSVLATPLSPLMEDPSECSFLPNDILTRSGNESGIGFKQSLMMSFDKTMRLYKASTSAFGRSTPVLSLTGDSPEGRSRACVSEQPSWEDDKRMHEADSPSFAGSKARTDGPETDNGVDRMTVWLRNVEKLVEDTRQNFAATTSVPPAPLPISPVSRRPSITRSNRSTGRMPRKILAASEIFADVSQIVEGELSPRSDSVFPTSPMGWSREDKTNLDVLEHTLPTIPSEQPSTASPVQSPMPETPRRRRATVVTRSPEPAHERKASLDLQVDTTSPSPSKRREKSKSQNDLARPITPVTRLEFELEQLALPPPAKRLSELVDRNLFIAQPPRRQPSEASLQQAVVDRSPSIVHVEPYPPRPQTRPPVTMDTPARKHVEVVYDRFLMSTTGVKRVGKGYQSDNAGPVTNVPQQNRVPTNKYNQRLFNTTRRRMPPPVSSEDILRESSVDEFGVVVDSARPRPSEDQGKNTVAVVRRAFKAIVTAKPVSNRFSRAP
ncbi:kinase-like protein [Obba rivulosa]|uniref:Kinase-like protein n=1 Tax=Obba rivulosa TaxID=1052685 RepID=A0A8E2DE25_9APHY|nr:kinase-like protein [Obba rivulosa]